MKIICDKNTLSDAIQTVSRAVAVKSNLASIEGILFVAENGTLTLTGYDFEMGIKTTFECDVDMEGDIVLSSSLLGNIVKKSTDDRISIECDDRMNCKIKSGMTEYNIKGIDSTDYPDFPTPSSDNSIKIENRLFCEMVDYLRCKSGRKTPCTHRRADEAGKPQADYGCAGWLPPCSLRKGSGL